MTTATGGEIAHHFNGVDHWQGNWGTCSCHCAHCKWNVTDDTYINGIMVTVDRDYNMFYLLEVVERGDSWVSHMAVAVNHTTMRAFEWHEHRPYPFFERPDDLDLSEIYVWFVRWADAVEQSWYQ